MELDAIDQLAAKAFDGFIVRKDLVRQFKNQYPVPTYVVEFLLGRYCASVDEQEIQDGLQIVQRQLADRTVRAGTEELFKSRARESGSIKMIDIISARLDARTDSYLAELPSLQLRDVRIDPQLVQHHDRMLTGGFYAEVELVYDAVMAQEHGGRPFWVESLREIQLSKRNVLDTLARGRTFFTTDEWSKELVGDRDPRAHEFSIQLRAFDASRSGSSLGVAVFLALCSALLQKSIKGGLVVVGGLNLGGSIDPVYNAVSVAELAVEKGATTLLIPITARKPLNELSDEMAARINIQYYTDSRDALIKALAD